MNCFVVFILFLYLFSLEMFQHFFGPPAPMSYVTPGQYRSVDRWEQRKKYICKDINQKDQNDRKGDINCS